MQDNRRTAMTLLLTAAGATTAFFAVRAVMHRVRSGAKTRFEDWHSREFNSGQTPRQKARSAQISGYRMRSRVEDRPQQAGSRSQQMIDQPDRQPIPTTGHGYSSGQMSDLLDMEAPPVSVEDLISPMAQYLISFNHLIEMLRERRASGVDTGSGTARSISPGDRTRFEDELQRLDEMLPEIGDGSLGEGSLQERIYQLMWKTRDGLQNLSYDDDDLFRINGEIRSEACRLMKDIRGSGIQTGEDFEEAYRVCG